MVLDDGGDHDVGRIELQAEGDLVDGLGGVPAEDGDVGAVRIAPGKRQHRPSSLLVGGGGMP